MHDPLATAPPFRDRRAMQQNWPTVVGARPPSTRLLLRRGSDRTKGLCMDLDGKVALVTGASRGVGAATAIALAQAGCRVACAARSTASAPQRTPGTLDDTVARINADGGTAIAVPTNLAEERDVVRMVATTAEELGGVDILVNNAAITFSGGLDIPLKRHDLIMEVNFRAPFIAIREVAEHMRRRGGGAIVNLSSMAAFSPIPGLMSYGASKIALERLTLDAAVQLRPERIAVNCFRIDIPVASEGFVANTPGLDRSDWEPAEVAAEGILWMLRQPPGYSGRRESMYALRNREHIMSSRAQREWQGTPPPTQLLDAMIDVGESVFR
ncbi:MAG TPA: SDR family NAD(P)-dependent oxidoreductase [Mycobacteriales bacterium]|nr:SDR family NAD(P)-dependent oxidoreductase [Mycobacteriales bacterium]